MIEGGNPCVGGCGKVCWTSCRRTLASCWGKIITMSDLAEADKPGMGVKAVCWTSCRAHFDKLGEGYLVASSSAGWPWFKI